MEYHLRYVSEDIKNKEIGNSPKNLQIVQEDVESVKVETRDENIGDGPRKSSLMMTSEREDSCSNCC